MLFLSIGDEVSQVIKDALNINLTAFLINIIGTIILILIVRFFFWNKVTAFLDKKREKVAGEFKDAEKAKADADRLKIEAQSSLETSKKRAGDILSTARNQASSESEKILLNAKNKAAEIVKEGQKEAKREKDTALKEAKSEMVEVASKLASKMIKENIDQEKYNDKVLDEIGDSDE